MSRAFVKESDDLPQLPERPLSPHPNLVTARGLRLIDEEIARYRDVVAVANAREDRAAAAAASRELRYWAARRASAELQPAPDTADVLRFGATVTVVRDDGRTQTYQIVGEDEADPAAGTLSYVSPLARALLGKGVGDVVRAGPGEAEVMQIEVRQAP